MNVRVIVNPTAGAGAASRKVQVIRRALSEAGVAHQVAETTHPGHATALAAEARRDGVDTIAVVGGDGTLNEVVQAYLGESGAPLPGPALAVVPAGTGGDFRRALGLGKDAAEAVTRMLTGSLRAVDLGVVEVVGERGEPVRRAFVNIASFGVSGKIDRLVNRSPKWMGGRVAFAVGTVRAMTTYRNAPVAILVDGTPWYEGRMVVTAVANGPYFGGGMKVAPLANPCDGLLDVVVVGDVGFAESLQLGTGIYSGRHVDHSKVQTTRGTEVEARPLDRHPVYVDADGETPGRLPFHARLFPGALGLRV
jgi:YegS/Rv2252/BmrU family lipid kinase